MSIFIESGMEAVEILDFLEMKGHLAVWYYDVASETFSWSTGMRKLLGLASDEIKPSENILASLMHPQDRQLENELSELLKRNLSFEREFRIIQPGGRLRWLLNRGDIILDTAGNPKAALVVSLDTTVQHESNQTLTFPYLRLRSFISSVAPLIWTARADGSIIEVIGAPGLSEDLEIYTSSWLSWVHDNDLDAATISWREAAQKLSAFDVEHQFRGSEAEWFHTYVRPIFEDDGQFKQWNGLCVFIGSQPRSITRLADAKRLTAAQLRAARAILRWSVSDLSGRSTISTAIIRRLEESDGQSVRDESLVEKLKSTLQEAGVEFVSLGDGEPATRLRQPG